MTEPPKTAEKQPDQADPQKEPEPVEKPNADQRRVLVCLNCGHIWEAKAGTVRPQCFDCKRQRVRSATAEEIAQFDQGVTKIVLPASADSGTQKTENPPKNNPDQADQHVDQRVDPVKLVDPPVRLPKKPAPKAAPFPALPFVLFLVMLGVIAAMYYFFARAQAQDQTDQYYEEMAAAAPPQQRFTGATLPGM